MLSVSIFSSQVNSEEAQTVPVGEGLVAHWLSDQESGETLIDRSGNGNTGNIRGATWIKTGSVNALAFKGAGSYVDFGDKPQLKTTGDFSFSAWIRLDADPYPNMKTNWHIFGWETYTKSGMTFRIAGGTAQPYFRTSYQDTGKSRSEGDSNCRLANHTFYHVVVVKRDKKAALYVDGLLNAEFPAKDPLPNNLPFTLSTENQSFAGSMDNVRLYNRAISAVDVAVLYKEKGAAHNKDVAWLGKLTLKPFIYAGESKAVFEADLRGVLPLKDGEKIVAELCQDGKAPIVSQERAAAPPNGREDFVFDLKTLTPGAHEVRVSVRAGEKNRVSSSVRFDYPAISPVPPAPKEKLVASLPDSPKPPAYSIDLGDNGGFTVRFAGQSYPVESVFSYPYGGENRLTSSLLPSQSGEKNWTVQKEQLTNSTFRVTATGKFYRVVREIETQPTRIMVKDRIENLTDADLGLSVDNRIDATGKKEIDFQALAAPIPPVFATAKNHGVGLVPLNDIYQMAQKSYLDKKAAICGSKIDGLGIAKGGAHNLEWAVYPITTTDYYDLINAIREDEGLNGLTVDGCLAMSHSGQWLRTTPPPQLVQFGGLKYASSGCLTKIADDPEIAYQGFEFTQSPKEIQALNQNYERAKKLFPGLKVGFHFAYNIYATNTPEKLFPDSRMIASSGRHDFYANPSGVYFSKARVAQGWAFYPFYPTLANSFGKELLKSVDVMMNDIGAGMVWADGLLSGYGAEQGNYPTGFVTTLEPWDGYSVILDANTKTVAGKYGRIASIGKDALIEYVNRVNSKGGRVWINHMFTVPRSFARLNAYWAAETNDGDHRCASLHLSPAPHGLAKPTQIKTAQMIYDDIRGKLSYGALYTYYWMHDAKQLTYPLITTDMYPITIEELHAGCIKGKERIITLNSGVYGWPQDSHLHQVRLYDERGRNTVNSFFSTLDKTGLRTRLDLAEGQSAVVVKLPVVLKSENPVNVCVTSFQNGELAMTLNGKGSVTMRFENAAPSSVTGAPAKVDAAARTVSLELDGPVSLRMQ